MPVELLHFEASSLQLLAAPLPQGAPFWPTAVEFHVAELPQLEHRLLSGPLWPGLQYADPHLRVLDAFQGHRGSVADEHGPHAGHCARDAHRLHSLRIPPLMRDYLCVLEDNGAAHLPGLRAVHPLLLLGVRLHRAPPGYLRWQGSCTAMRGDNRQGSRCGLRVPQLQVRSYGLGDCDGSGHVAQAGDGIRHGQEVPLRCGG
mmetsp:Transcript_9638/g.20459  ORF Transcript_9638/g.20459 Transcript_9638/m.20459 type:complete len:202 (-) Transcript_9638:681-1286(-)